MEAKRVSLFRPKKFHPYTLVIVGIYAAQLWYYWRVRNETVAAFFAQPLEERVLKYAEDELAYFKEFQMEIPPIQHTAANILQRWAYTDHYDGVKLLFLVPVTLHLTYLLFIHWSGVFRAHAILVQTTDQNAASHAMLLLASEAGNTQRQLLLPIHHQIYNKIALQRVEFEGEQYKICRVQNELQLVRLHKQSKLEDLDLKDVGLSHAEHHHRQMDYGVNRIVLRYPHYVSILKDSILSPYFAFQIFTSVLYAADQFAMYSFFSIIMLVFVEGANVFQKYNARKQICKLAPQAVKVMVRRDGEDQYVSSDTLVPGDVVVLKKQDYNALQANESAKKQTRAQATANTIANAIPFLKIISKFKDMVLGKYYDESILAYLRTVSFSAILPVDMVVLQGQLITDEQILTGEQVSQIKEQIDEEQKLDVSQIQAHNIVYGGSSIIQIQSEQVVCQVIKIAEQTEQGRLIRTIAFNEERMNVTTKDSLVFLLIMVVVAVFSAAYCFIRGYLTKIATLNRLFLETLLVFVNVVAPDLPTELSMCISNSIREVRKKKIFSTEPYKILNAGRLQYVCFDKSGTLTQSNIKILGVDDTLNSDNIKKMLEKVKRRQEKFSPPNEHAELIISACQSITKADTKFFGDNLEINAFNAIDSQFGDVNNVQTKKGDKVNILKRYYFNSTLKRMSVVAAVGSRQYVLTKGGPEILQRLLATVPHHYERTVEEYVKRGLRVLALAYRPIEFNAQMTRDDIERQLIFAGLLVCQTPLKTDTANAIQTLKDSDHLIKVISGDHVLNVAVTCQQCGILQPQQPIYVIDSYQDGRFVCSNLQGPESLNLSLQELVESQSAFCITNSNPGMDELIQEREVLKKVTVFARTTPAQKQRIILALKNNGGYVGYVGDGCNDLNALQASDVGMALMEEQDPAVVMKQERVNIPYPSIMGPNNTPATYTQLINEAQARAARKRTDYQMELRILLIEQQNYKRFLKLQKQKEKQGILQMWSDVLDQEEDTNDIKMGDATIAAHFTIKSGSLNGVLDIIRQGRCALTTVQMNFKTIALNCLIGAYSMTVLTLSGVRSSNYQLIAESMLSMVIMMNIGKVKEAKQISRTKPPHAIVGPYLLCSTFGQAAVHIACLFAGMQMSHFQKQTVKFSTQFAPTEMNTVIFYIRMIQDVCVTLVNFPGRPHMQSIFEHKMIILGILLYCGSVWLMMIQAVPELNEQLGLIGLNSALRGKIAGVCLFDVVACFLIENVCKKVLD